MKLCLVLSMSALLWASGAGAQSSSFPADSLWTPVRINGVEIHDSETDAPSVGGRNVVGGASGRPSLLVAADADNLYFRLRLADSPINFMHETWGCVIDADNDPTNSYEYFVGYLAYSASEQIEVWQNTTKQPNAPADEAAETFLQSYSVLAYGSTKAATDTPTSQYWRSWGVPRFEVGGLLNTPFRLIAGTSSDVAPHLRSGVSGDIAGTGAFSDPIICNESGCAQYLVGVSPLDGVEMLAAPWPNPVRGEANLRFEIVHASPVVLTIHNLSGKLVATILDGAQSAGIHTERWNGRDLWGNRAPAGVYFVRLEIGGRIEGRKFLLLD